MTGPLAHSPPAFLPGLCPGTPHPPPAGEPKAPVGLVAPGAGPAVSSVRARGQVPPGPFPPLTAVPVSCNLGGPASRGPLHPGPPGSRVAPNLLHLW